VLTVKVDGLESGDVDLCANGDVLEIRGRSERTRDHEPASRRGPARLALPSATPTVHA